MWRANRAAPRVRNEGRLSPMTPTPPEHLTQGLTAPALTATTLTATTSTATTWTATTWTATVLAGLFLAACQPTVKVEAPQEPITINLNIKLDADIRLKIEEQAEKDIEANPDIF